MTTTPMPRFADSAVMHLPFPPDAVFPLLCPVREYDWIPIWKCDLLHAETGAAETDCVFRTAFPDRGVETWTCSRYEPNKAVEYVRFADKGVLIHLSISLAAHQGGTRILWSTVYTATSETGAAAVADMSPERYAREAEGIAFMLAHYLEHGTAAMPKDSPLPSLGGAHK